ncbi:tubulin-dependent ATPase kip3 [Sorochytrium milnesiophthora]
MAALAQEYEAKMAQIVQQLNDTQGQLQTLKALHDQHEEEMKTAFMRGVSALNKEAMSFFKPGSVASLEQQLHPPDRYPSYAWPLPQAGHLSDLALWQQRSAAPTAVPPAVVRDESEPETAPTPQPKPVPQRLAQRPVLNKPPSSQNASATSAGQQSTTTHKSGTTRIQVAVRVRPPTSKENAALLAPSAAALPGATSGFGRMRRVVNVLDESVVVFDAPSQAAERTTRPASNNKRSKDIRYAFDRVFDENATQHDVFQHTTMNLIDEVLGGYNCTVFAYGATGCGKTFTMTGNEDKPGVIFLTMQALFDRMQAMSATTHYEVSVSYLEIYNETIRDLLLGEGFVSQALELREDAQQIVVVGLSKHFPRGAAEVMRLITMGNKNRTQSPTEANCESSRSHAVLQVTVKQRDKSADLKHNFTMATCNFIDLAGSERASGANINRSLLALGNCINALGENAKPQHIPYRDSKLTRLLKNSLNGNCKTVMICAVAPGSNYYDATEATLRYASRAKNIKTNTDRNVYSVDYHVTEYTRIIKDLRDEVLLLRGKLGIEQQGGRRSPTGQSGSNIPTASRSSPSADRLSHGSSNGADESGLQSTLVAETTYQTLTERLKGMIDSVQQQELDMIRIDSRIFTISHKAALLEEYLERVAMDTETESVFYGGAVRRQLEALDAEKNDLVREKYELGHAITAMRFAIQKAKSEEPFTSMPELYQRLAAADIDGELWRMNDILLSARVDYLSNTAGIESLAASLARCHADLIKGVRAFLRESQSGYVDVPFLLEEARKHDKSVETVLLDETLTTSAAAPAPAGTGVAAAKQEQPSKAPAAPRGLKRPTRHGSLRRSNTATAITVAAATEPNKPAPDSPRRLSKTIKYTQPKRRTSRLSLTHNLTLQKLAQSGIFKASDTDPLPTKPELKRRVTMLDPNLYKRPGGLRTPSRTAPSDQSVPQTPQRTPLHTPRQTPKHAPPPRHSSISAATTPSRPTTPHRNNGLGGNAGPPKTTLQTVNGTPKVMTRIRPSAVAPPANKHTSASSDSPVRRNSHRSKIPLFFKKLTNASA